MDTKPRTLQQNDIYEGISTGHKHLDDNHSSRWQDQFPVRLETAIRGISDRKQNVQLIFIILNQSLERLPKLHLHTTWQIVVNWQFIVWH